MSDRGPDRPSARRRVRRPSTRALGRLGEQIAEDYLSRQGIRILGRNIHLRHAEIDLVGLDGRALCFVEVRLRSGAGFGGAGASVDARKQRRLIRAASELLATGELPRAATVRFDVVAIEGDVRSPRITHYRDAFRNDPAR